MTITLRPDQSKLQQDIFSGWQAGQRNGLAVLPTGGGKSVVVSDTVRVFDDDRSNTLVMAHRQELVGQMSLHVARQGIKHRILAPKPVRDSIISEHRKEFNGQCFVHPDARCNVGGVDTILSRLDELADLLRSINLAVTDEAHHCLKENKWGKVLAACSNAFGLGVTATPQRADGKGLGAHAHGIYNFMALGPNMRQLINAGHLCDYEIVCPTTDFPLDELIVGASGDVTANSMKAASEKSHIVGDVVEQYCIHAYGKRGVVFATDVETSVKIAEKFVTYGIPAAAISAKTPDEVRSEYIRRLRDGRLWVLVNVDLLGEGFDLPAIEVVIMARPTASLAVYMQQFGRALRTLAGKLFGLVIDLVSNVKNLLFPDMPRNWSLDAREGRGKSKPVDPEIVPMIVCKACTKPFLAVHAACPHCGSIQPGKPGGGGRTGPEQVMGDLTRLDAETLARMRKAAELPDPATMADRAAFAGHHGGVIEGQRNIAFANIGAQKELADALALWGGYQRSLGRADPESYMRFYHATGLDVLSALAQDRKSMQNMTTQIMGWLPK